MSGSINLTAFQTYVERVLVLELRLGVGDVVIMDNVSRHKGDRTRHLIEQFGASLMFLPPYSPNFNLIENAFAKRKGHLRKAAAQTLEAL